ncbi:DUF6266 family protein [Pedobacter heparinus]|uniref:Uncharacterized protein n=1 Tax=Pedobacter heparinus (strain ATCC 13125 / DSM 2366 / CIP 104194 / JCM 7457 / NBRC 12017 / NCIMB 9290 / NRRL B-14731 / HIM 762-3) TaxID=485917 RepID=C6Y2T1_PEDHD|nr:DUF6266 family protein [Pedobacter heparinus]ACU03144.1 hypothetical protein Phep_0922 [Pedobacter heparinus DSM 2366]
MAKLKKGIFGPLSGKLGAIVGATWMGIPYIRQAPKQKTDPAPRSAARLANEEKMKFVNNLLVPFHPYVNIGFANLAIAKTALNAAYSRNFHQAVTGVYPNLGVDYTKMVISAGDLPGLNNPVMALTAPDVIGLTWAHNTDARAAFDDQLMLMLYCPALKLADGFIGGVKRIDERLVYRFLPALVGKTLEVYLGLTSLNRKKIADSVYLGRIVP